MKSLWNKLHRIGDILHLPEIPNWLLGLLFLVLIFRIPSFFEPYYYGDEMIYLTLGQGVRQGVTLYQDLHDNKPPLLYLLAAVAGNLFWFKVILAFWSIATIYFFYKLAEELFEGKIKAVKLSTLIFAILTTIPLMEGNIANAELFMIGPTIIAFLILLRQNLTNKRVFFAGTLIGIATLFKVPAMFDLPVIIVYWLISSPKNFKEIIKNSIILGVGFVTPILVTFAWYFMSGAGPEYIRAAFMQNVGYLSSFRPGDVRKPFIERNLPLLTRGFVVLLGSLMLYLKRKSLSKRFLLLSIWTLFALFAITLSERPYPHYFIQTLAPFSILATMFFLETTFEQVLVIFPLALSVLVPVYFKFYFYPTASYYQRFVNFAIGKYDKTSYLDSFSKTTSRNYKLATFIATSSSPKDRVFMWDPESAAVYSLAKRLPPVKYTVPYHVNDFSNRTEVAKLIIQNPPKFIILTSGNNFPELNNLIRQRYLFIQQIEDSSVYSRIDLAR